MSYRNDQRICRKDAAAIQRIVEAANRVTHAPMTGVQITSLMALAVFSLARVLSDYGFDEPEENGGGE